MSKVRINDLARELEVKSNSILDALTAVGVTAKKTHSSSIEFDEAEKVRAYLTKGRPAAAKPAKVEPKFDLSGVSKPGDALKAILARKAAESGAVVAPPKKAAPAAQPVSAPAPVAAKPAAEPVAAPAKKTVMPQPRQPSSAVVAPPPAPPAIASRPLQTTVVVARPPAAAASPVAAAPAAPAVAKPAPPPVEETPAETVAAPPPAPPAPAPRRVIMPQTGPRPSYTAPPGL